MAWKVPQNKEERLHDRRDVLDLLLGGYFIVHYANRVHQIRVIQGRQLEAMVNELAHEDLNNFHTSRLHLFLDGKHLWLRFDALDRVQDMIHDFQSDFRVVRFLVTDRGHDSVKEQGRVKLPELIIVRNFQLLLRKEHDHEVVTHVDHKRIKTRFASFGGIFPVTRNDNRCHQSDKLLLLRTKLEFCLRSQRLALLLGSCFGDLVPGRCRLVFLLFYMFLAHENLDEGVPAHLLGVLQIKQRYEARLKEVRCLLDVIRACPVVLVVRALHDVCGHLDALVQRNQESSLRLE
mmetsp:Transcript_1162/g.3397  ORF Transcript_1162/g.3397 Transcript_1162/m.3397 type:complete len:291 (-) Transcript_1162:2426-3298(-)